jgi:hypothetical protein
MANLVNLFIDRQICEMDRIESEGKAEQKVGEWQWMREENIEVMPRVRSFSIVPFPFAPFFLRCVADV